MQAIRGEVCFFCFSHGWLGFPHSSFAHVFYLDVWLKRRGLWKYCGVNAGGKKVLHFENCFGGMALRFMGSGARAMCVWSGRSV